MGRRSFMIVRSRVSVSGSKLPCPAVVVDLGVINLDLAVGLGITGRRCEHGKRAAGQGSRRAEAISFD